MKTCIVKKEIVEHYYEVVNVLRSENCIFDESSMMIQGVDSHALF